MTDNLANVPPALILILREIAGCDSWSKMRRRVKSMLKDLRDQSEVWERDQIGISREEKSHGRFDIHLHGAMNLLANQGCSDLSCRVSAAERLARSVGLIADRVWLTDLLSGRFVDFGRPTNAKIDSILREIVVLSRLLPLITAGVVRFRSPWIATCSSCMEYFNNQVDRSLDDLVETYSSEFKIERLANGNFTAYTGNCMEPQMIYSGSTSKGETPQHQSEFARDWIEDQLHTILWAAREAALTGGTLVSNSRLGLAGLMQQEGRLLDASGLNLLDREREFSVPWVSELDAQQIVELRQEASQALPLFREKMFRAMSAPEDGTQSPKDVILDLREQAEEVRAELTSTQKNSAKYWKVTYGVLGLGLSAYGVASDQVIAGVGGLLPILQLLIGHKDGHGSEIDSALSKPGYVLLKAQEILAHDHSR